MGIGLASVLAGITIAYYADLPPGGTIVLVAAARSCSRQDSRRSDAPETLARVSRSLVVNLFYLALAVIAAATLVGLVTLWPREGDVEQPASLIRPETFEAEIVVIAAASCPVPGQRDCRRVTVELLEGADEGDEARLTVAEPPDRLDLDVGDHIRVAENRLPAGAELGGVQVDRYSCRLRAPGAAALARSRLRRTRGATGRWQGLRALFGLFGSLVLLVAFIVPAILEGSSRLRSRSSGRWRSCWSRSRSPTGSARRWSRRRSAPRPRSCSRSDSARSASSSQSDRALL